MGETCQNDAFELVRGDETILVVVKILEALPQTFALQTLHQLSKLIVAENMGSIALSEVEFDPIAVGGMSDLALCRSPQFLPVKVERNTVGSNVL